MARSDPEKLAQALRVNLRRRKSGAAGLIAGFFGPIFRVFRGGWAG